jgi:hypothetical protein
MIRLISAAAAIVAVAVLSVPAHAEVKSASPSHFEVESKAIVAATPAAAYAMLGRVGEWWSASHTYSGSTANLKLELRAGGCFCERTPKDGGTIEHLRIVQARPGTLLRASGGLGPLQAEAVAGTLSWSLKAVPGGTEITQNYAVSGRSRTGLETLAPLVDRVLAGQLEGLRKRLAR